MDLTTTINNEKEEVKCLSNFNFSVLCTSSKQVEEVLNCRRRNKKVCNIFQFTDGYDYWKQVCLQESLNDLEEGDYGYEYQGGHSNNCLKNQYDDGDLIGYEMALFKKGHGILITFIVKDGSVYDWVWGDVFEYILEYKNFKSAYLKESGIILYYSDFNNLIENIINKESFVSLTNVFVSSFKITKTIFNIDLEEDSNYEKLLKNTKEIISSSDFIQNLGNFIKIDGLGYNFLIRKSTISYITINTVYVNENNIDNFNGLDIDEPVGSEVLIYLITQERPVQIHFYENELTEMCYNRLINIVLNNGTR